MCKKINLNASVGDSPQGDDISKASFRHADLPPTPSIYFDEARLEDIPAVTEFVEQEMERLSAPMKAVVQINIAIDEIFSNIVRYGYPKTPGPVTVEIIEQEEPRSVCIRFSDEGIPYNPITAADPDITLSAEERSIGGLGIFMVKKTMDDVKYTYENGKNILTIQKKI